MIKGGTNPARLAETQAHWQAIGELLNSGQYERAAEILRRTQATSEQAGEAILVHILDAAGRICLACNQCHAQAEWHRDAGAEAAQREQELRRRLDAILDLVDGHRPPPETEEIHVGPLDLPVAETAPPLHGPPEPARRPPLVQYIQRMLGRGLATLSSERKKINVSSLSRGNPGGQRPPTLVVYCLGAFRVYQNDQLITEWDSLKARSILKYLTTHHRTPTIKDVLMDLLWPDADPEAARRNLHQAIYSLRQTLRRGQPDFPHIQFQDDCYLLNPEMELWVDCEEFEKHVQTGQRWEAAGRIAEAEAAYGIAENLYEGDFLEEDVYEDWPRTKRDYLRTTYLDLVNRLTSYYLEHGEYTPAITLCRKVLVQDNCREEAHHRLMQCYLAQGQRHLAVRQYQACVEALKEELGLTPSEETAALYHHITSTS